MFAGEDDKLGKWRLPIDPSNHLMQPTGKVHIAGGNKGMEKTGRIMEREGSVSISTFVFGSREAIVLCDVELST